MTPCWISRVATMAGLILLAFSACGRTEQAEIAPANESPPPAATAAEPVALDEYPYSSHECLCLVAHALPEPPLVYPGASAAITHAAFLFEEENFDDALASFNLILAYGDGHAEDHFNRGVAHMRLTNLDEAIADFNRAIQLDPNLAAAHLNLGIAHYRSRDGETALRHIADAIGIEPAYALAYWNRGHMLGMQTDYEAGLVAFDMAVQLAPDDPFNLMGRAVLFANMDRLGDARADLQTALALTDDPAVIVPIEIALRNMADPAAAD